MYTEDAEKTALGRYDLLSVVSVNLVGDPEKAQNELVGMLSTLLSQSMPVAEKKERLEEQYHLPMTRQMEKEVSGMCNLSEGIVEATTERVTKEVTKKVTKEVTEKVTDKVQNQFYNRCLAEGLPEEQARRLAGISVDGANQ